MVCSGLLNPQVTSVGHICQVEDAAILWDRFSVWGFCRYSSVPILWTTKSLDRVSGTTYPP